MTRLLFDLEADNLYPEVTRVHCIVTKDLDTGEVRSYFDHPSITHATMAGSLSAGCAALAAATELRGHNILSYDIPTLDKVLGVTLPTWCGPVRIRDTLICSQHMWLELKVNDFAYVKKNKAFPMNLIGSHSLKAWGMRLGEPKGDLGDKVAWSVFTQSMLDYCVQDIQVNSKLSDLIDSKKYSDAALDNEHNFAYVMWLQEQHGFRFDKGAAVKLYGELSQIRTTLERKLQEGFSGWTEDMKTPEYYTLTYSTAFSDVPFTSQHSTRSEAETERKTKGIKPKACVIEAGPLKKKITPFNPGSHDHIATFLIERYGWKPKQFGDDGKASTTEEILQDLKYKEIPEILQYLMVEKRIGQLAEGNKAWLRLEKKGRIHGRVMTNGAVSTRVTHSNPNLSQVPAVDKPFGKECRALFVPDEGQVLVGADASGIQLRLLAHFMSPWDKGEYAKIILTGDIHSANQKAGGFATRDISKTFCYAFLLGAGAAKVGSIAGVTTKQGQELIDRFLATFPALATLRAEVVHRVKTRGYLIGLDGRILPTRSEHAALSSLLQGGEAATMKRSTWLAFESLTALGLKHGVDFSFCAMAHDELQISCRPDLGETVGKAVVSAIEQSSKEFNLQCPLTGEFKIGNSWSATH